MSARSQEIRQFLHLMTPFLKTTLQSISLLLSVAAISSCEKESSVETYTNQKILIKGNTTEPQGLDPQVVTGVVESNIIRSLFEGLCVDHPSDPSIHLPGAAVSWKTNADFTEWKFRLQPNGKWSDGKPVTAHDFVFSYHRILTPAFGAKYSSMLYYIKGAEDYNKNHKEIYLFKDGSIAADILKKIHFHPNTDIDLKKFEQIDYEDLTEKQKIKYVEGTGLNSLNKNQLNNIRSNPKLAQWPQELAKADQIMILNKLIETLDKDFWDDANVGVKAIDDLTLQISLKSPVPFLPDLTKHYTWYPVPKHTILKYGTISERRTSWTEPENMISNGPFKMKDWQFNYQIEADRNPHYWDFDTVKLNGVRFLPISNTYTEARMFYNDQIHVTDNLAPELIEYSAERYPENVRQETYLGIYFLRMNNNLEEFRDPNVRKAFAYATDSDSIIKYILKGGQKVATSMVPPMGSYKANDVIRFDPKLAKEHLAKTKYADNPSQLKIVLLTTDKEGAKLVAEALQSMWKEHLGISVKIEQREWKSYLDRMSNLDYGISTGGWIGDYPDPTTFLDIWKKGDGNNRTGWSSEEFEEKLKQAETISDAQQRIEALRDAEMILLADMPIIPIYWYTSNYLIHKSVKNWHPMIMKNQPYKFIDLISNKPKSTEEKSTK